MIELAISPHSIILLFKIQPFTVMGKKILLNVLFNLGIILSVFGMIWSYNNNSPLVVAFFGATFVAFIYVKIQLVKSIKNPPVDKK